MDSLIKRHSRPIMERVPKLIDRRHDAALPGRDAQGVIPNAVENRSVFLSQQRL
jgi:hypothetical protein